jgi:hypothetical protein
MCIDHIGRGLKIDRPEAMTQFAALCRVDKEAYLRMASDYFGRRLSSAKFAAASESLIGAVVANLTDVDSSLLKDLVSRTLRVNRPAGETLRTMILDNLAKPWVSRRLG